MIKFKMKYNGRTVTSSSQLEREVSKSLNNHVEKAIRSAAGPGVSLRKTSSGYVAEGTAEQIERMHKRLS